MEKIKAAFVGFGEINSPVEIIERKCAGAKNLLEAEGFSLVYTNPVSDDSEDRDVKRAIGELKGQEFDVLIVCIAGWIPSHAVIGVISEFKHVPMVLWGLAGYYENGRLMTTADQAGTTALRKVMEDMGYTFKYVYDIPGGHSNVRAVVQYAKAARASKLLRKTRAGMMGYRDMTLYGTLFDAISLRNTVGVEIEIFEMLEMVQRAEKINSKEIHEVIDKLKSDWEFERPAEEATLETGARYYLALKEKIRERGYQAISLIDVDGMKKLLKFPPSMIFMLLSDQLNICTIPENDALGSVTQLMVKYLTGQAAAYLEFYEFMKDRVLAGVPDFVPGEIVSGRIKVCPTRFGSFSQGILNVSKLKTGKVTLCRLTCTGNRYGMHIVTGEAVTPKPWEEAGWAPPAPQLPGLEVVLDGSVEDFAQKVMSQHYIVAYGDHTGLLKDFCTMLGIKII